MALNVASVRESKNRFQAAQSNHFAIMTQYEKLSILIQIMFLLAGVVTVIVYWRQLVAMQKQVAASRDSSRAQNLISLVDYIQRPEHRDARRHLLELKDHPMSDWSYENRIFAERACSSWDITGILLREGAVPNALEIVLNTWGYSIANCYEVATDLIRETRTVRGSRYWDEFEWLAKQAQKQLSKQKNVVRP